METRKSISVRLNTAERRVLRAAARQRGCGWTSLMRQLALEGAVDILEEELEDVRPPEVNLEDGDDG